MRMVYEDDVCRGSLRVSALERRELERRRATLSTTLSGSSPRPSASSMFLARCSTQRVTRFLAPRWNVPSRIALCFFLRLPTGPFETLGFFFFFLDLSSSAASSFPHGLQSRPPSGSAREYGVTVKRLEHRAQFSIWPGRGFLDASKMASARRSSSLSSPPEFFLRRLNALDFFIFSIVRCCSSRLRFLSVLLSSSLSGLVGASGSAVDVTAAFCWSSCWSSCWPSCWSSWPAAARRAAASAAMRAAEILCDFEANQLSVRHFQSENWMI